VLQGDLSAKGSRRQKPWHRGRICRSFSFWFVARVLKPSLGSCGLLPVDGGRGAGTDPKMAHRMKTPHKPTAIKLRRFFPIGRTGGGPCDFFLSRFPPTADLEASYPPPSARRQATGTAFRLRGRAPKTMGTLLRLGSGACRRVAGQRRRHASSVGSPSRSHPSFCGPSAGYVRASSRGFQVLGQRETAPCPADAIDPAWCVSAFVLIRSTLMLPVAGASSNTIFRGRGPRFCSAGCCSSCPFAEPT